MTDPLLDLPPSPLLNADGASTPPGNRPAAAAGAGLTPSLPEA